MKAEFTQLAELIEKVGETYDADRHMSDFGLESADYVADFYNNGGLEFSSDGLNFAVQYVAVEAGKVTIGTWVWEDDQDFDLDAEFIVYDETDYWKDGDLHRIYDAIVDIYAPWWDRR